MRVLTAALYGPRHTYGYPDSGTTESIEAISRDDVEHFWQQNYFPDDAALVVTGNIKLASLKPLLEKRFGAWKAGRPAPPALGSPETTDAKLILVDRPGAPQTTLVCFSMGLARSTPDYAPVEVMNTDLGGLFSSRINMNLREAHGYTYGAGSFFNYHRADRKSTRLNSSHLVISYAVFCLKKKTSGRPARQSYGLPPAQARAADSQRGRPGGPGTQALGTYAPRAGPRRLAPGPLLRRGSTL